MSELPNLLTVPEVAQALRRSVATLYRWMDDIDNPLPYIQLEGGRLIEPDELRLWLDSRKNRRTIAPVLHLDRLRK